LETVVHRKYLVKPKNTLHPIFLPPNCDNISHFFDSGRNVTCTNGYIFTQFHAQKSQNLQKKSMFFLGNWAILKIFSGSVGYFLSVGDAKYFHQMNAGWNLVNLRITGFALHNLSQNETSSLSYTEALTNLPNLDKI
jgi:hypothetical protein